MADQELRWVFNEIEEICKKHNLSIGHEDTHGGFQIHPYHPAYLNWLRDSEQVLYEYNQRNSTFDKIN